MDIPFGKYKGHDLSDMGYAHLPYMRWMQSIVTGRRFKQELEWRITDLEWELYVLETYYT